MKPRTGYRIYRVKFCGYPYVVYKGNERVRQFPSLAEAKNVYPTAIFKMSRVKIRPYVKARAV